MHTQEEFRPYGDEIHAKAYREYEALLIAAQKKSAMFGQHRLRVQGKCKGRINHPENLGLRDQKT